MVTLNWQAYDSGDWCSFEDLDLDHPHFNNIEGVYIIWHGGNNPAVVYVGQGIIKDRISDHRENNQEILSYRNKDLYVTWAATDEYQRDGIERYLANTLKPLVGDEWPKKNPITVNIPW